MRVFILVLAVIYVSGASLAKSFFVRSDSCRVVPADISEAGQSPVEDQNWTAEINNDVIIQTDVQAQQVERAFVRVVLDESSKQERYAG